MRTMAVTVDPARIVAWIGEARAPMSRSPDPSDGLVIVSFIVDDRGRVDLSTVRPFLVSDQDFSDSVMTSLASLRFFPATVGGGEAPSRVTMPFQFSIVR